jgi:hypothetical protein
MRSDFLLSVFIKARQGRSSTVKTCASANLAMLPAQTPQEPGEIHRKPFACLTGEGKPHGERSSHVGLQRFKMLRFSGHKAECDANLSLCNIQQGCSHSQVCAG